MIDKYTVVSSYNLAELEKEVQHALDSGWQPWGRLVVVYVDCTGVLYSQAMVLCDDFEEASS